MSRVSRVLLVALLIAGPAMSSLARSAKVSHAWSLSQSDGPAAMALPGVFDPPVVTGGATGAVPVSGGLPLRLVELQPRGGVSVALDRPPPDRLRHWRRHRPAPRSSDGEPPH